jgi:hypothetical protein
LDDKLSFYCLVVLVKLIFYCHYSVFIAFIRKICYSYFIRMAQVFKLHSLIIFYEVALWFLLVISILANKWYEFMYRKTMVWVMSFDNRLMSTYLISLWLISVDYYTAIGRLLFKTNIIACSFFYHVPILIPSKNPKTRFSDTSL